MTVLSCLVSNLSNAAIFNPDIQVSPTCILWPDQDRQFETVILRLQSELPELLVLGDYKPENKMGPAIWLRCVLSEKVDDIALPDDHVPILYLPGVGRQDLRAVESCPNHLKPLAELQYRGAIWSQINSKDWTILAFLKSDQGGLALDISQDSETKNAMRLALSNLLDEEIELLNGKRLDKDYFNSLLSGDDPVRDLLKWIDLGDAFAQTKDENEWHAFNEVCKSKFGFTPQNDGVLAGAEKLATHNGPWQQVWDRYCEAPARYRNIPAQIRKCTMPSFNLFAEISEKGNWPQWNEGEENRLQQSLSSLENKPAHEARKEILDLEKEHGARRKLIWTELGESTLAQALEHLAVLSEITTDSLAAGTIEDIASSHQSIGWQADNAVLKALAACIDGVKELQVVSIAIRSIYLPWAEDNARYLQKVVTYSSYPGETIEAAAEKKYKDGECVMFVDGLRFDTGKRLASLIEQSGLDVTEQPIWSPLPSVTATGKPSVTPVYKEIKGIENSADFEPSVAETGQSLKGGYHLKRLLGEAGWQILERNDNGDSNGNAWCEFGDIDHEGHDRGWKLAKHVDTLLEEIQERISELLNAGWKRVHVVTDHGWLLLPGGLPKIELPSALTNSKWGRCAIIKPGADTQERLFPWYWNPHQYFALADGISCFKKGDDYNHGGLSVQECLVLELTISNKSSTGHITKVDFTDIVWQGLRCKVAVDGEFSDLKLDIRTEAGNPESSVVLSKKSFNANGMASVVIEDEDKEGNDAMIVLLDSAGNLIAQNATVIGGGDR